MKKQSSTQRLPGSRPGRKNPEFEEDSSECKLPLVSIDSDDSSKDDPWEGQSEQEFPDLRRGAV